LNGCLATGKRQARNWSALGRLKLRTAGGEGGEGTYITMTITFSGRRIKDEKIFSSQSFSPTNRQNPKEGAQKMKN